MILLPNLKIWQLCYFTTLIATEIVLSALTDYCNERIEYYPHSKFGRYYSFMPLEIKKIMIDKFDNYCEKL